MRSFGRLFLLFLLTGALAGCVQMPTHEQSVVDNRPRINFAIPHGQDGSQYQVILNGVEVGTAGDFRAGQKALVALPGPHVLTVRRQGQVIIEERIYLGDGATRTFTLN